jgi:hypothetical protein
MASGMAAWCYVASGEPDRDKCLSFSPRIGMQKPAYSTDCIPYGRYGTGRHWQSIRVAASIRPPRLLVEDNGASHPLRESGGGLAMVLFDG